MIMNQDPNDDALFSEGPADHGDHEARRRRQRLLNLLRGRWHWVAILAVVLGGAFATAGYFSQETLYASAGKIQLTQVLPKALSSNPNQGWTSNEFLQTEMALI